MYSHQWPVLSKRITFLTGVKSTLPLSRDLRQSAIDKYFMVPTCFDLSPDSPPYPPIYVFPRTIRFYLTKSRRCTANAPTSTLSFVPNKWPVESLAYFQESLPSSALPQEFPRIPGKSVALEKYLLPPNVKPIYLDKIRYYEVVAARKRRMTTT